MQVSNSIITEPSKTFRLVDFHFYDEVPDTSSEGSDNSPKPSPSNRATFTIQMFGINEIGETATIFVKDYLPFFFIKVPKWWKATRANEFVGRIMYQMGSYCKDSFIRHEIVNFNKLYGFSAGQKHQFLKLYFKNTIGMRRVKNMWYQFDKQGNMRMVNYNFDGDILELYESSIPPLLRYFHIQNISPSGWIRISDQTQPLLDRTTTTTYEFSCNQEDIIPLNDKETRVPYKICSFDIEASSSHGDFPIPVKSYKRLATNLIDYYLQNPAKYVNSNGTPIMGKLGPMLESVIENAFGMKRNNHDIDLVYPKYPLVMKSIADHVAQFTKFVITETAINNQANSVESVFEKLMKQSAAASANDEDADADEDAGAEDGAAVPKSNKPVRHTQSTTGGTKTPKSQTVLEVITHPDYSRDEKIQYMTTAFDTCGLFPPLEGDKCTFIGSTFLRYGESEPYLNHCVVLGGCDPVDGAVIETAKTEEELLMRWRNLIIEEDPDIIIGYNIFGFDYEFLFRRAEENHCEREFLTLSRVIGDLTAKEQMKSAEGGGPKIPTGKLLIENTKVVLASGEYDLRYFNMTGRLQIDMYSYFRRDFNLASYKLDDVAGQFISDDIKRVEVAESDSGECHTRLFSKNLMGLHVGDYIHIELNGFTADYYMDGHKFQVQNILYDQTYVSVKGGVEKTETANVIVLQGSYSELADMFAAKTLKWCMAKDDVSPQDIFRLTNGSDADRARVAKYCLQDCNLVHHLMRKIDVITGYVEMSSICSVPISYLVFRGQGIKLTSYVAKKCREKNTLMPDLQKSSGGDGYEGAIVLPPKCAMYMDNPVACVDYSSLYPSSMISQNYSHDSKVWTREYDLNGRVVSETGDKDPSGNYLYDNLPGYEYINVEFETFKYVRPKNNPKAAARKEKTGHKVVRWAQLPAGQKSIMPSILEELLQARSKTRKLIKTTADPFMQNILDKRQLGYKVTANSLYGQCGAKTSTFYEQDVAASTTATGRTMIIYAKRMIEEVYGDRVYETAALGPVQCRAEYVYGDTDSVFFTFNLENPNTGTKIRGKPALEATIEIAQDVAKLCTQFLKPPMELSYEKTLMNFILLAKKRYVGMLHETDPNKGYLKFMGLSLKRRDSCDYLKDTYGGILNILMKENSIKPAIDFLNTSLNNLLAGTVSMDKLAITKALRSGYKNPKQIAHCVLADRIGKRDPGNKPKPGDRMKFVYFVNSDKGALQGDKIELPQYIIDAKLKIDYKFYITNQLMKPLQQLFGLALEQIYTTKYPKREGLITDFQRRIRSIQAETSDLEEYMKRREKECSARVKQELFDPFLMKIHASQNGIRQLDSFWKPIGRK